MKLSPVILASTVASTLQFSVQASALEPARDKQPPVPARVSLDQIVRPQARDRWTGLITRGLTPERVEDILRGAFGGQMVAQWELFDLMEDTWPRLKKNLNEIKESAQRKTFCVRAYQPDGADDASPRAQQKAAIVKAAMMGCQPDVTRAESGWEDALYDTLDAFGKGTSIQEILWGIAKVQGKPAILPKAFRWVHPLHYGYPFIDPNDDRLMLCPTESQADWMPFPENKFIIATFRTKTGHPLGTALLRSLATLWIGANFSYEWALNLAQLFGIPMRWATYDPTQAGVLDDICEMLENMGSAGWGAFPAGTTLELKEAISKAADNPQAFVMHLADTAADLLILGQTLTSEEGKRGSQALGNVHMSVREQRVLYVATWLAQTLSYQFVAPLMRLNFGDNDEDPWIEVEQREVKDAVSMAQRDAILIGQLRMDVPKDWLYERHEIPLPEDGAEIFQPTQPALPGAPGAADETGTGGRGGGSNDPGRQFVRAKAGDPATQSATDKLVSNVLENLSGVEAKWLGGIKPIFADLVAKAKDPGVSDADLIKAIDTAQAQFPELFGKLDVESLAGEMEKAMTSGLVNGVSRGFIRKAGTRQQGGAV